MSFRILNLNRRFEQLMFLVLKKVSDLEYLVLDTQDGVYEKVSKDDLLRAKSLGFKVIEDDSMLDYTTLLKSLTKESIMHTLDTDACKQELYKKIQLWGSKIKDLPQLKDFNGGRLKLFVDDGCFIFVVNESVAPVYDTGDAYLFKIKENGVFGKLYKDSYIDVYASGIVSVFNTNSFGTITLNLLGEEVVTFNSKTAVKKRGRLSHAFASILDKI